MPEIGEIRKATEIGRRGGYRLIWLACASCKKERWVILQEGIPVSKRCRFCANGKAGAIIT